MLKVTLVTALLLASSQGDHCPQKHGIEVHDERGRLLLPAHTCNVALNVSDLQYPPEILIPGLYTNTTQKYTLIFLERQNNTHREIYRLHWLLANISPLNHSLTLNKTSTPLVHYIRPSTPHEGTANYTIIAYKQNISDPLITLSPSDSQNFGLEEWLWSLGRSKPNEYTRTSFYLESPRKQGYPYHTMPGAVPLPHQPIPNGGNPKDQYSFAYSNQTNYSDPNQSLHPHQPPYPPSSSQNQKPPYPPNNNPPTYNPPNNNPPPYNPHYPSNNNPPPYNPPAYKPSFNDHVHFHNYSHYNHTNGSTYPQPGYPHPPSSGYRPPVYKPNKNSAEMFKIQYSILVISCCISYFLF